VGAIGVEVVQVLVEVALEAGDLGDEGAGECRPPALLEDRQLQALAQPFELGLLALIRRCRAPTASQAEPNSRALNSDPLSGA
jgi:hypothetical protein